MTELEERYGFAKQLAPLTDVQLVDRFNREVGNPGWGHARVYFLTCLSTEIRSRAFDSSIIFHTSGMKLNRHVKLSGNTVVHAEDR
jgi:hypothetical protein